MAYDRHNIKLECLIVKLINLQPPTMDFDKRSFVQVPGDFRNMLEFSIEDKRVSKQR